MEDLFDGVLSLEDTLYTQGHDRGLADGARAGKLEGRSVGVGTGFDKFSEGARLYGRSVVWANRLQQFATSTSASQGSPAGVGGVDGGGGGSPPGRRGGAEGEQGSRLPPLPNNARLAKNVESVHALMEPGTLSTENNDEAVQDFDDRLRRAQGRARVVERTVGAKASRDGARVVKGLEV